MLNFPRRRTRHLLAALVLSATILTPGCIERTMVIRTEPTGADVVIDGEEVGKSPVTMPFQNYGTRQLIFSARGCRRKKLLQPVRAPWYETFPIDFFVEMIWPWTVRDLHVYSYKLEPIKDADRAAIGARAEELRKRSTEPGAGE